MEILAALSRHLKLSNPHQDLDTIADRTEGFTGADLQALLYNAQLLKINQATGEPFSLRGTLPLPRLTSTHFLVPGFILDASVTLL